MTAAILAFRLALAATGCAAWAQRQYEGLPFPPHEIFDALTGFAESSDFPAVQRAASRIKPLFKALDPEGRKGLEHAVRDSCARRDAPGLRRAVLALILEDLHFNLAAAREDSARVADLLQMAFIDYQFLSPAVRARDKGLDAEVRRGFKAAYRARDATELAKRVKGLERQWH